MFIEKASLQQAKIKIGISGPSGSGKTFSALLLAYGLCGDFNKICVVDSENKSASLYTHLGDFQVINLFPPHNPEKYVEAIHLCEQSQIEVIILDSISHEWNGKGGCLELHEKEIAKMRVPNSFTAWRTVTPRHQTFIDAIINSSVHVISTLRSKTEYVITERNGKQIPTKVGMAPITRDGMEYELTISFDLDQQHKAFCSKDRTRLFIDQEPFIITPDTGRKILEWCNAHEPITVDDVSKRIGECRSIEELLQLYQQHQQLRDILKPEFEAEKRRIIIGQGVQHELTNQQIHANGTE